MSFSKMIDAAKAEGLQIATYMNKRLPGGKVLVQIQTELEAGSLHSAIHLMKTNGWKNKLQTAEILAATEGALRRIQSAYEPKDERLRESFHEHLAGLEDKAFAPTFLNELKDL